MKYDCPFCGILCFDGTTDETLQRDIKQHESNSFFHKRRVEEAKRTDGDRELGRFY